MYSALRADVAAATDVRTYQLLLYHASCEGHTARLQRIILAAVYPIACTYAPIATAQIRSECADIPIRRLVWQRAQH
jgi:hypothetical protein